MIRLTVFLMIAANAAVMLVIASMIFETVALRLPH